MASSKHHLPLEEESEAKKVKLGDDMAKEEKRRVGLNPADCGLDFDIEDNGLKGSGLHEEGFAYCWSGARGNAGITKGKYCFSCKIISAQPVNMEDTAPDQQHVCRLGISRGDDAVGNLGETDQSFGFGGTGKFSSGGKFSDYGEKFGVGDTIVCAVDLESKPLASIGFFKNGKWLGTAKQFDAGPEGLGVVDSPVRKQPWESALFPHILLKNVVVQVQFSVEEGLIPVEGFESWAAALTDGNAIMGPMLPSVRECDVMMMVGLPASGKTTWAEKLVKEHPEKRYVLLGTNLILDQMKVPGLLRKHNYGERFDRLMGRANAMFDTLLSRAARTPRNYIFDQTNVFKSARKRKLRPFVSFHKVAVVVFPIPDELKFRSKKRYKDMGKEVPADAVNNMLANFVLPSSKDTPGSDELFDEVMFVELDRGESQRYLDEMKRVLPTSNPNLSTISMPSFREGAPESYTRPVAGAHWQSPRLSPPPLNHSFPIPQEVNLPFQQDGSYSELDQNYQIPSFPRAPSFYRTRLSDERRPISKDSYGLLGSYGDILQSRNKSYQSYGVIEPYNRLDIDDSRSAVSDSATDPYTSSVVQFSTAGNARNSLSMHGGHGMQIPRAIMETPRVPSNFSGPRHRTSYGSPYRTPVITPSYGNFPADTQQLRGSAPQDPTGNFATDIRHSGGYAPLHPRGYAPSHPGEFVPSHPNYY